MVQPIHRVSVRKDGSCHLLIGDCTLLGAIFPCSAQTLSVHGARRTTELMQTSRAGALLRRHRLLLYQLESLPVGFLLTGSLLRV